MKKRGLSGCPVRIFHMQVTLGSLGLLPGHVLLVFNLAVMAKASTLVVLNQVQSTTELECNYKM